jgi:hypothetical protein
MTSRRPCSDPRQRIGDNRHEGVGIAQPRLGARWHALLLVLLLSLSWQTVVLGTHRHLPAGTSWTLAASGKTADTSDKQAPADQPAGCAICAELANSGAYLVPTAATLAAPALEPFHFAPSRLTALALPAQKRGWQSRAPPLRSQA